MTERKVGGKPDPRIGTGGETHQIAAGPDQALTTNQGVPSVGTAGTVG